MVLDAFDVAAKMARAHDARTTQMLVVDGMRFDLASRACSSRRGAPRGSRADRRTHHALLGAPVEHAAPARVARARRRGAPHAVRRSRRGADARPHGRHGPARARRLARSLQARRRRDDARRRGKRRDVRDRRSRRRDAARAIAKHARTQNARTLLFVLGDHGFRLEGGAAHHGGASPRRSSSRVTPSSSATSTDGATSRSRERAHRSHRDHARHRRDRRRSRALVRRALGTRVNVASFLGDRRGKRVALLASPGAGFRLGALRRLLERRRPRSSSRRCIRPPRARTSATTRTSISSSSRSTSRARARGRGRSANRRPRRPSDEPRAPHATSRSSDALPALMLYTSGTTGKPKGAVLTHANLAVQQELLARGVGPRRERRPPPRAAAPPHARPRHRAPHVRSARARRSACSRRSTRARIWDDDGAQRPSSWRVPTMYTEALRRVRRGADARRARAGQNARALRLATSGSAALPVTLAERWRAITGDDPARALRHDRDRRRHDEPARTASAARAPSGLPLPHASRRRSTRRRAASS